MRNYIKFIPYAVIIILVIMYFTQLSAIERGKKLERLNELWQVWNNCETQQLNAQKEAKTIREELGLSQPKPEAVTGTVVDQLNKAITLTWK